MSEVKGDDRMPKQSTMEQIFDSWDWHLYKHLEKADSVASRIMTDMALGGIPARMYIPYLQNKVVDMIQQIAEQR